jgi:hypothetical protein
MLPILFAGALLAAMIYGAVVASTTHSSGERLEAIVATSACAALLIILLGHTA